MPFVAMTNETGEVDFRVTDVRKWHLALKLGHCPLCNTTLGRHRCFIGGPQSMKNRYFFDLPMHRDCAEYALRVCPYLAVPGFKYSEKLESLEGVKAKVAQEVSTEQPSVFYLGVTRSCTPERAPSGAYVVRAAPWDSVTPWKDGEPLLAVELNDKPKP